MNQNMKSGRSVNLAEIAQELLIGSGWDMRRSGNTWNHVEIAEDPQWDRGEEQESFRQPEEEGRW